MKTVKLRYSPNLPKNAIKPLKKAAEEAVKEINQHFKRDKWALDYSFYVTDIFYKAFHHHLENYLLVALSKYKYQLIFREEKLLIQKHDKKIRSKQNSRTGTKTIQNRK